MGDSASWLASLNARETVELKPWERLELLEYLAALDGDRAEHVPMLLDGPVPPWRLDDLFALAARSSNERIASLVLSAGATPKHLELAAAGGMAELCRALVDAGVRVNRMFQNADAPIHLAAASSNSLATARVLIDACCDLTVRSAAGKLAWELCEPSIGEELKAVVGTRGPTWFREAQTEGIDHYVFVDEESMFGFNPNDVQTPIWTGDETEGFGWPNTPLQARMLLEDNGLLRHALDWFRPFLDKLVDGEDFSLDELGPRVPRRRPSWR